jgi:hypothetical protein
MDWTIFLFVIAACVGFAILFFVLETAGMANLSITENLKEMWRSFFGKDERDDDTPNPRLDLSQYQDADEKPKRRWWQFWRRG